MDKEDTMAIVAIMAIIIFCVVGLWLEARGAENPPQVIRSDNRVTLKALVKHKDTDGQIVETWEDVREVSISTTE
jgi:FtsZ-interacting cell division protein ZipA